MHSATATVVFIDEVASRMAAAAAGGSTTLFIRRLLFEQRVLRTPSRLISRGTATGPRQSGISPGSCGSFTRGTDAASDVRHGRIVLGVSGAQFRCLLLRVGDAFCGECACGLCLRTRLPGGVV